jgi:hypothetical protein
LLPSVARQLPILDVTWRSCFFVPSPRPSYIGETVWIHVSPSDAKIFRKLSSARAFEDSLFLFDFIYFVLRSHDTSQDLIHLIQFTCSMLDFHYVKGSKIFWIIHGKDSSFWWYTWRHLYLDLLFSVRYRGIETNMISWICSSNSPLIVFTFIQGVKMYF